MKRVDANLVPFAKNNPSGYRFAFGTDVATDDINTNYNDNIKKGWGTTPNEFPEVEDFNAMAYTTGYLLSYLYQMGIPEWNDKQEYRQYSRVVGTDGIIYKAKTGTDLAPNVDNNPTTDSTNWEIDNQFNINSFTNKNTPIDTDNLGIQEIGGLFKKLSWANLKATLKTYFNRSIVAGTVRQDPTDRTKWLFISDSEHTPIGVSGTYGVATGNSLVIDFNKTYSKVISFVIAPDETLARSMGMTVGASVGLDKVTINASVHTNIVAKIYWNGTAWVVENLDGQNGNVQVSSYVNGALTLIHTYCKGANYSLNAWTQQNTIYPYIPILRNTGEDAVSIFFMDTTTGQFVVPPTPSTKMSFVFSKQSNTRQIRLDGTDSATIINNVDLASGNLWFYGIFEE